MRLEDIAITVVGLGVVGGSFAEGLKKAGAGKVYGIDNNLETLKGEIDFLENYPKINGQLTSSDEQFYEIVKNAVDILKKNSEQLDRLIGLLERKRSSHIRIHS